MVLDLMEKALGKGRVKWLVVGSDKGCNLSSGFLDPFFPCFRKDPFSAQAKDLGRRGVVAC